MSTLLTELDNAQQVEVGVSGPDGVNRLIICNGIAPIDQRAESTSTTLVWKWRVGPILSNANLPFRRAIVNGGLCRISQNGNAASWSIAELDADWNDDLENNMGQVEVTAEVIVNAAGEGSAQVQGISYHVSILLAMPAGSISTSTSTPVSPPATLALTPAALDFGTTSPGEAIERTVTVSNSGTAMLPLGTILSGPDAGDFYLVGGSFGTALAAGASQIIKIRFNPRIFSFGSKTALLTITSTGGSVTTTLSGRR